MNEPRQICYFRSLRRPKRANRKKNRENVLVCVFCFHRLLDLFIFKKRQCTYISEKGCKVLN